MKAQRQPAATTYSGAMFQTKDEKHEQDIVGEMKEFSDHSVAVASRLGELEEQMLRIEERMKYVMKNYGIPMEHYQGILEGDFKPDNINSYLFGDNINSYLKNERSATLGDNNVEPYKNLRTEKNSLFLLIAGQSEKLADECSKQWKGAFNDAKVHETMKKGIDAYVKNLKGKVLKRFEHLHNREMGTLGYENVGVWIKDKEDPLRKKIEAMRKLEMEIEKLKSIEHVKDIDKQFAEFKDFIEKTCEVIGKSDSFMGNLDFTREGAACTSKLREGLANLSQDINNRKKDPGFISVVAGINRNLTEGLNPAAAQSQSAAAPAPVKKA